MIRRLLSWLFGLPTLIILLLFALANRHAVQISLDPLTPQTPWLAIELPLWAVMFAGILLGMLTGGMAAWVKQSKWRRLARHCQQQLELERIARRRAEDKAGAAAAATAAAASKGGGHAATSPPPAGIPQATGTAAAAGGRPPALPKA